MCKNAHYLDFTTGTCIASCPSGTTPVGTGLFSRICQTTARRRDVESAAAEEQLLGASHPAGSHVASKMVTLMAMVGVAVVAALAVALSVSRRYFSSGPDTMVAETALEEVVA